MRNSIYFFIISCLFAWLMYGNIKANKPRKQHTETLKNLDKENYYQKELHWLKTHADLGDVQVSNMAPSQNEPQSQVFCDTEENYRALINWFKQVIAQENSELPFTFEEVGRDQFITWLKKTADKGDADAEFLLGSMYFIGKDIEQNSELAIHLLNRAAQQGSIEGKILLERVRYHHSTIFYKIFVYLKNEFCILLLVVLILLFWKSIKRLLSDSY